MNSTVIKVIDRTGEQQMVGWTPKQSLMECLRDNDLPVLASCGGTASCSTCHVYLEEQVIESLGDRTEDELDLLIDNEFYLKHRSRLACQVAYEERLSGVEVTLAPEE